MANSFIISDMSDETLDKELIPNVIYDQTIKRETKYLKEYFFKHPQLMMQFAGFNSKLKQANQLASERKCGCFYEVPWITKYAADKGIKRTRLLFVSQVNIYRYMIRYWYPYPIISNMAYLSRIALQLLQTIGVTRYYIQNNLNPCTTYFEEEYSVVMPNNRSFIDYINNNFIPLKDQIMQ